MKEKDFTFTNIRLTNRKEKTSESQGSEVFSIMILLDPVTPVN